MFAQCYCVCIYALYTFMHNAFLKEMSLTSHVMLVTLHQALRRISRYSEYVFIEFMF